MNDACNFGCRGDRDRIGILIAQLGTPEAPTAQALRPYLKEFLGDPRVIEVNRAKWWFILNAIILNTRPKRSARLYKRIWTEAGSPLLTITREQTEGVRTQFRTLNPEVEVAFGMRYGKPSLAGAIDELIEKGCSRLLLFPMYPQYSAATTGSTYDAVFEHLLKRRWVPTLRVAEPYYKDRRYIEALARTINEGIAQLDFVPEKLVLSYHGIPEKYVSKGDPYCCMCTETTAALLPLLKLDRKDVIHTYQSRFGKDPWLVPYTDRTIEDLGKSGIKRVAVACPGFTADCLETLDEIGNEALESFHEHGGEKLQLIPSLNAHPAWIDAMSAIIRTEIDSWIDRSTQVPAACWSCPVAQAKKEP